jgi:hypothetical protein
MRTSILLACCLGSMACNMLRAVPAEQREQERQFQAQQETFDRQGRATEERFKNMTVSQLLGELEQSAAKGREPFNAPAFREVLKRKDAAQPLFASIAGGTSQREYFKLMALKRLDSALYARLPARQGAAILTDALARSETFNAWGIPNNYWETSAKAIIEYGAEAAPFLERLLDDTRPAPVWGSEEAMIYEQYRFRVKDYAFALLNEIAPRQKVVLPVAPVERDALITAYRATRK